MARRCRRPRDGAAIDGAPAPDSGVARAHPLSPDPGPSPRYRDPTASTIAESSDEIVERLRPFDAIVELWTTFPGVSTLTAQVPVAEIGADMDRFPTAAHLASWAGVAPAPYESAGHTVSLTPAA